MTDAERIAQLEADSGALEAECVKLSGELSTTRLCIQRLETLLRRLADISEHICIEISCQPPDTEGHDPVAWQHLTDLGNALRETRAALAGGKDAILHEPAVASESIPISDIVREIDHIKNNGINLQRFGGDEIHEGRCRELCAMYLQGFIEAGWRSDFKRALGISAPAAPSEPDAATAALNNIAKLCGCEHWEYPGQVVRDVMQICEQSGKLQERIVLLEKNVAPSEPAQEPVGWVDQSAIAYLRAASPRYCHIYSEPYAKSVPLYLAALAAEDTARFGQHPIRQQLVGANGFALNQPSPERLAGIKEGMKLAEETARDAERYAMLFKDTWHNGEGIAIFSYTKSHDDFERLGIAEATERLDAAIRASQEGTK